jgi:hypothetical protein
MECVGVYGRQSRIPKPHPSALTPKPHTLIADPTPETLIPQPATLNPQQNKKGNKRNQIKIEMKSKTWGQVGAEGLQEKTTYLFSFWLRNSPATQVRHKVFSTLFCRSPLHHKSVN